MKDLITAEGVRRYLKPFQEQGVKTVYLAFGGRRFRIGVSPAEKIRGTDKPADNLEFDLPRLSQRPELIRLSKKMAGLICERLEADDE